MHSMISLYAYAKNQLSNLRYENNFHLACFLALLLKLRINTYKKMTSLIVPKASHFMGIPIFKRLYEYSIYLKKRPILFLLDSIKNLHFIQWKYLCQGC